MDVLGEVLATLELSSRLWFRAELSGPFAVAVPPDAGGTLRFHVASEGACTVAVEGGTPVRFAAGDLVMVPHGAAHVLADGPGRPAVPLSAVLAAQGFDGTGSLVVGTGSPGTVLVCGQFRFGSDAALHPFLTSLPPLLHVPADEATSYGWIEPVLRHIEREARMQPTGYREVVRRLSEIMLIELLRAWDGGVGALSALADPQLGRALQALHAEPEADWTLDDLARIAGQSRTLFAERFRERMGVPAMRYLASWRLQKARHLLARPGCSVGEAARRVGYASESAFHRAFRARYGASPGAWRRALAG